MAVAAPPVRVRVTPSEALTSDEVSELRDLLWAAFASKHPGAGMTEDDWRHAVGGVHFRAELGDRVVAHAAVVERTLWVAGRPLRAGYLEAVATAPACRHHGFGTAVVTAANEYIAAGFELGALGTGLHGFYERLGWQPWLGQTFVRNGDALVRTAEEDGYVLVLETPSSPPLERTDPIACDWRPGDAW